MTEQAGGGWQPQTPELHGSHLERALGPLNGLQERPLSEHVGVYEQLHRQLQEILAQIEPR
jgi:hypothetical protein